MHRRLYFMIGVFVPFAMSAGCARGSSGSLEGEGGQGGAPAEVPDEGGGGGEKECSHSSECSGLDDACNHGACVDGRCVRLLANDQVSCDDGLFCTVGERCQYGGEEKGMPFGVCKGGIPRPCGAVDDCHAGSCDEESKSCVSVAANEGSRCDDGDPCTLDGLCSNGACLGAAAKNCSIFDSECSVGVCEPGVGCRPMATRDGEKCEDGKADPCFKGVCTQGVCVSVVVTDGSCS